MEDYSIRNEVSDEEPDENKEVSVGTGCLNEFKNREVELKGSLKNEGSSWKKRSGTILGGEVEEATPITSDKDKKIGPTNDEPQKRFMTKCKDHANEMLYGVINKLLDNMGTPVPLQRMMALLMVAGESDEEPSGFGYLEEDSKQVLHPEKDSGIHSGISNQGGQLPTPAQPATGAADARASDGKNLPELGKILEQEVQVDGKSESSEDLVRSGDEIDQQGGDGNAQAQGTAAGAQSLQGGAGRRNTPPKDVMKKPWLPLSERFDERSHKAIPQVSPDQAHAKPKVVWRRFPQTRSYLPGGVRYGSEEDLLDFVSDMGSDTVPEATGVFLDKFASRFEINGRKNFFKEGTEYNQLITFQDGKDVHLCWSNLTRQYFVTKWVPLVEEVLANGRQMQVLQRKQQVDLVVVHQDSCPWGGLATIYGLVKRRHGGRIWAEIFMEYCEGETLLHQKQFLRQIRDRDFLQFVERFVDIFKYLHDHDIIHGDVKVENAGYRSTGPILFDFEAAKHPQYKMNSRGTFQCLPHWVRQCFRQGTFDLLKTLDLWGLGVILLRIHYHSIMYGQELQNLRSCDTCEGVCAHLKQKFLALIEARPGLVNDYLPPFQGSPAERTLISLIRGFLTSGGPHTQFATQDALDILQENLIAIHVMIDGIQRFKPILVRRGTRMKDFIKNISLITEPQFRDGFWLSVDGVGRQNVDLNQTLTDCCLFHIHPTVPAVPTSDESGYHSMC